MFRNDKRKRILLLLLLTALLIFFIASEALFGTAVLPDGLVMTADGMEPMVCFETPLAQPGEMLQVEAYGYMVGETLTYRWRTDSRELETQESWYIPEEADLEQFIEVTVSSEYHGEQTARVYCSRLPVVYIDVENNEAIDSKEEYKKAEVTIQGAGDSADYYYEGTAEIRGRGNTSWEEEKKPYKLKLYDREGLLGMDSSRSWILLANYVDSSLMRNKLMFDLALEMDMPAPESCWVSLIVNGVYAGNYQLCEQIDLGTVIDQREGILLELDEYYDEEVQFHSSMDQPIMIQEPEDSVEASAQLDMIEVFINAFETAIRSPDYTAEYDDCIVHYSELFDMDALAKYWVLYEVFHNCDFMRKSTYIYIDPSGMAYMGPPWDNDWSSGIPPSEYWDRWSVLWFDAEAQADNWYRYLIRDTDFRERAREIYWEYRDQMEEMVMEGGVIDRNYWLLYESALSNDRLWKYGDGYEADVTLLRNWLSSRLEWLDQQFATEESLEASLSVEYESGSSSS